ncbi:hypothetical protein Ahy_B01g057040 isoform A [Arachis hypogaea]|uniref:Uncharacterized protein n=1 Tax=Arachis hypogaea TaxID=3818 RepID=A0A445B059_ARAHY|nr:hypothetical protein Ahy_B01g057040 isoform A [Arachis hypogaea]
MHHKLKDRDISLCPRCNVLFDAEAATIFEKERMKKNWLIKKSKSVRGIRLDIKKGKVLKVIKRITLLHLIILKQLEFNGLRIVMSSVIEKCKSIDSAKLKGTIKDSIGVVTHILQERQEEIEVEDTFNEWHMGSHLLSWIRGQHLLSIQGWGTYPKGITSPAKGDKGKAVKTDPIKSNEKYVDLDKKYFDEDDEEMFSTISIIPT